MFDILYYYYQDLILVANAKKVSFELTIHHFISAFVFNFIFNPFITNNWLICLPTWSRSMESMASSLIRYSIQVVRNVTYTVLVSFVSVQVQFVTSKEPR